MKIVAKSGCSIEQLLDRQKKGFQYIELQLAKEFVDEEFDLNNYTHVMSPHWDIQGIHMPLIPVGEEFDLEYLGVPKYSTLFLQVCQLAQACADYYKHSVMIVIHCGLPLSTLLKLPDTLDKITTIFKQALDCYSDITLSIENITSYVIRNNTVQFRQNCFTENVELAQYFNEALHTTRMHTTLDICHYLMTQLSMQFILDIDRWKQTRRDLEFYFCENQSTINNIHLNNMRELGISKMNHGASFDETNPDDMELLDWIFSLYKKYHYACNLTLEVDEVDYSNVQHAPKLKELIEKKYPLIQKDR